MCVVLCAARLQLPQQRLLAVLSPELFQLPLPLQQPAGLCTAYAVWHEAQCSIGPRPGAAKQEVLAAQAKCTRAACAMMHDARDRFSSQQTQSVVSHKQS